MADGEHMSSDIAVEVLGEYDTHGSPITYRFGIAAPGDGDFSLANFFGEDAAARDPELARRWGHVLQALGATRAFAPNTAFTRNVARPDQLNVPIELPNGIVMHRNERIVSDAVMLPEPGDAMVFAGGGCSLVTMVCGTAMVAGHGGLDALIDRSFVLHASKVNRGSIIETMATALTGGSRDQLRHASCRAFGSVPRKRYQFPDDHEEHGEYNAELEPLLNCWYDARKVGMTERWEHCFVLDQGKLIEAQARKTGIRTVSTCLHPLRRPEYAHTRHINPGMRDKRNALVVVRVT